MHVAFSALAHLVTVLCILACGASPERVQSTLVSLVREMLIPDLHVEVCLTLGTSCI